MGYNNSTFSPTRIGSTEQKSLDTADLPRISFTPWKPPATPNRRAGSMDYRDIPSRFGGYSEVYWAVK